MKNPFKNNPLSLDELAKWINNPNYNPRSGCKITENGQLFKTINKSYLENKILVDDLYDFYKQTASDNYLNLICKKGLDSRKSIIEIDGSKLNQVLINLLSNSFKFTEKGGITIIIRKHEKYLLLEIS